MESVRICQMFALVVVATHSTMATQKEDVCLKFGCMEQMLERMIRLELKVKDNAEDITKNHAAFKYSRKIQNQKLEELSARKAIPSVAFSAYNVITTHISNHQVIKFDSVLLNEGNAYNSLSGNFIVPVDGLYEFNAHMCNRKHRYVIFAIICDHTELAVSTQWDDTDSCGSVNALAILKAGEKVFLSCKHCQAGSVFRDKHRRNSFSGCYCVLRADFVHLSFVKTVCS